MTEDAEAYMLTPTLPEPPEDFGGSVATLARAWVAVSRDSAQSRDSDGTFLGVSDADRARADNAAAYIVKVYDSPAVLDVLRKLGSDFPFAVALTRFADAADASLALPADARSAALQSAFSIFVEAIGAAS